MSEYSAKTLREKMKSKARALAGAKDQKTDSSDWSPAPLLRTEVKTGARPIMKPSAKGIGESNAARDTKAAIGRDMNRGAFKSGGAVKDAGIKDKKALGAIDPSPKRGPAGHYKKGGKIGRADGGRDPSYVGSESVTMDNKPVTRPRDIEDRRQREPQASDLYSSDQLKRLERGYKKGGKAHPDVAEDRSLVKKMVKKSALTGKKDGGGKWIQSAIEKPGALRKSLGVKEGEKIPAKKLEAASEKGGKLGKRARLAQTLGRLGKATGGGLINALKNGKKPKGKGAKTDINIVINAGHKAPMRHPAAGLMPPGADAGMPPAPPPGAGAPPPAMPPMGMPPGGGPGIPPGLPMGRKAGGRISKVASSYKNMTAGSGSGLGREQKTSIAEKHKGAPTRKTGGRAVKSYKQMDAGSGSGMGRIEKTAIEKQHKDAPSN